MANAAEILKLCRLCLVKDQVTIPIFDGQGDVKQIFLKITACLPIKVSRKDCLPKSICNACLLKLEVLYEFWNTTANSEKTLITWLNEAGVDTTNCNAIENNQIIPEEIILKEEAIDVADRDHAVDDISSDAKNYASDQQAPVTYNTPSFEFQNDILNAQGKKESPSKKSNNESSAKRKRAPSTRRRTPTAKAIKYEEETEEESAGEDFAAKVEDDSDYVADNDTSIMGFDQDESIDEPPPTSSASDQPGPSGVQKATGEPPTIPKILKKSNSPSDIIFIPKDYVLQDYSITICESNEDANVDVKPEVSKGNVEAIFIYKCNICDAFYENVKDYQSHCQQQHDQKIYFCSCCNIIFTSIVSYRKHLRTKHRQLYSNYRCTDCGKQFVTRNRLSVHLYKFHNSAAVCHICDTIISEGTLANHLKVHTNNQKHFVCERCGKSFANRAVFIRHKFYHRNERPYQCEHCGKSYKQSSGLMVHLRNHADRKLYICDVCGKGFNRQYNLNIHKRTHTKVRPYKCDQCDKTFIYATGLALHKRSTHAGMKPFQCEHCGKYFNQKSSLLRHTVSHTGVMPYECGRCGAGFMKRSQLDEHEDYSQSTPKPYHCEFCSDQFADGCSLTNHVNAYHLRRHDDVIDPRKCPKCDKEFTNDGQMRNHMRSHAARKQFFKCNQCDRTFRNRTYLKDHASAEHGGTKRYECHVCGKRFTYKGTLTTHMLTHTSTGSKRFECDVCGTGFTRKTYYEQHVNRHRGIKPFKCNDCGKSFTNNGNLTVHMKCHTGEPLFKCKTCGQRFFTRGLLKRHETVDHKNVVKLKLRSNEEVP